MQEYIKLFDTPQDADNYKIKDIPFFCYVNETEQSLVCNQEHKYLYNINNELVINDPKMPPCNFIDLGLSVNWAEYNAGVDPKDLSAAESWYGGFYAWGETETKTDYSWATYKHANGTYNKLTKYCPSNKTDYWNGEGDPDNKTVLDVVDDLYKNKYYEDWENKYRMPTKTELEELRTLPNHWVTNYNGVSGLNGRVFTGTNGNTLFIPAAGNFNGSTHSYAGSGCNLWSSSLDSGGPGSAWSLNFDSVSICLGSVNRYYVFSVRCVSKDI